ncbi:hypothetical protein HPB48_011833 [Haemaphysalis longicornis]|uniref:Tnf receptor-associated factor 6 n=1 Tax=Haemaphysalis longicornis TaxID=44386 RepID=A0A9J6FPB9_HAELO|nr:hypothetical protein HPB48_011833 [Haemaphysalis longicornis]
MTPRALTLFLSLLQVRCWNHRNGCNVVTAAADISKHFHHECGHHSARCPKCAAEIFASDVCAHLESRCDVSREPGAAAVHARRNASEEGENVSATRSDLSNGFQRIHNAISTAMSSIEAELRKIGRTMEITLMAATPRHEEADQRSFETRILQESLSQMTVQTAKQKDQLDEFMHNAYANQQTFYNSFVEKNEAFKQSLTDRMSSRIDQSELAAQFAAFREAMGDGQRETKDELGRLAQSIDRQNDRMGELLRSTDPSRETWSQNSAESAEAHSESLAQDASKIAWAKSSSAEDRQNALAPLPSIIPAAATHTWTIEEYRSLKQRAKSVYFPDIMLEPVYLRGYCVSAGVGFISVDKVYLLLKLHKGKLDRYLEWPFNLQIRLSILHPEGNRKLEYCVTPSRLPLYKDIFSRLLQGSDRFVIIDSPCFNEAQLEEWGFTKDGRVLLR